MPAAKRFVVSGRVQGVGFRFFVQDAARRENLTGLVRNLPDGSVEVEAAGEVESLDRFERALYRGPSQARVERVRADLVASDGRHAGFVIE